MKKGKVILAGAGPGDPELITVKAARFLRQADVIITDRLASRALLEVIYSGKEGFSGNSVSQDDINKQIVESYAPGRLVVRLKGGDVAFFSNILDELQTLVAHDIPFEIVPGITAASGASAYAGIPLTARGYARSVRFLTYYRHEEWSDTYWQQLAATEDTLVFYMSSGQLYTIAQQLLRHGALPDKPLLVIEQATTPFQRSYTFTLQNVPEQHEPFISPSLLVVGNVVALHRQFQWQQYKASGHYFKPA
jgi:uroporphyrin-III C-methyltransferase/precorrin-2 dehydrogenase/sirohydrochlorin ferrochelatase/uroporphyrin-III C-methyltransferase